MNSNYSIGEMYEMINILRKDATIIVTIFNPTDNEVFLLFISNKDDTLLEQHIETFIEIGDNANE